MNRLLSALASAALGVALFTATPGSGTSPFEECADGAPAAAETCLAEIQLPTL